MKLYTYLIPVDDGAAPNPYGGVCTLVICKPQIRRVAQEHDWVVGIGAKHTWTGWSRGVDRSRSVIYAMKLDAPMSMEDYDHHVKTTLPIKRPDWGDTDHHLALGDAIYDFSQGSRGSPAIRNKSVHGVAERAKDLSGRNALLSKHFYYFGSQAIRLPDHLLPIVPVQQGFRSTSNAAHLADFVAWIEGLGLTPGIQVNAQPTMDILSEPRCTTRCKRKAAAKREGRTTKC